MVTEGALASANVDVKTKLQVFGGATNTTPLIGIITTSMIKHALTFIKTKGQFSVLSYHARNRNVIVNATLPNGTMQLHPTKGQSNAN